MEKAPSKIALNSLVFFLVVAGVSLFSMLPGGAETTILVKRCSTNDDCKAFPCTPSSAHAKWPILLMTRLGSYNKMKMGNVRVWSTAKELYV
ncbi:unnamed protein product [Prunus armeniaca]|uniref:Pectin acetylesterase n=1 Tax=Prunus armeniaca TaxID=36596 RepID=A0A6J5XCR0_PRUAR|nr:unnamed protein product [Prunus armeniaca]